MALDCDAPDFLSTLDFWGNATAALCDASADQIRTRPGHADFWDNGPVLNCAAVDFWDNGLRVRVGRATSWLRIEAPPCCYEVHSCREGYFEASRL
jgi:hypothetical protein